MPVEIIPKIAGCDISNRYIQSYKKEKPVHKKDRDFLVYDACSRSKSQILYKNPSTNMHVFVEALESALRDKT